ncbi:hypothetical protein FDO65_09975 [Nakamurella flava]|uniref:Uncharacterized protein n=1 Tax=Nakamurella flava TaxID=2576308 RepID=A0A4U6QMI6_9ACTN|nr:hypothetical protein [Nakamurella flava]TKV61844.1 hypothetical protein FDO65_09975 [Nakamurella flava]
MSGDPRVPVVVAAIDKLWAPWVEDSSSDRPVPPSDEDEAVAVLAALDAWVSAQLSASGMPSPRFVVLALVAKLSRTQAALHAALLAVQTGAEVPADVVASWERIVAGEIVPVSDGLSG